MNDRELLKLAAKAAGIKWREELWHDHIPALWVSYDKPHYWNPLTDDGDALRLAVKLRLELFSDGWCVLWVRQVGNYKDTACKVDELEYKNDPCAATRRSIVSAAAEVGKGMLTMDEFIKMFPGRFPESDGVK